MPRAAPLLVDAPYQVPGVLVLRSKYTLPSLSPWKVPSSPRATASTSMGPGRDVNTMSLASATSLGVSAHTAPRLQVARGGLPPDVVYHHFVAALQRVVGHAAAHSAQTDESYLHFILRRSPMQGPD